MDQLPRLGKRGLICLLLCSSCLETFPLPLVAWDGLRYFIMALPEHSINYFAVSWASLIFQKRFPDAVNTFRKAIHSLHSVH